MAGKRHEKRFIIEVDANSGLDRTHDWHRSGNSGLTGHFATREEAQEALDKGLKSDLDYRIRQK